MSKRTLGLDISTRSIKAAQLLAHDNGTWAVEKLHARALSFDCMRDGQVREGKEDVVLAALKDLLGEAKFDTNDVIFGMNSSSACFMTPMEVPLTSPAQLPRALPGYLLAKNPTYNGVDNVYSYTVLGERLDDTGDRALQLMLYTVRGDYATTLADIIQRAGLRIVGADLSALAALRAVHVEESAPNQIDALVDIGAGLLSILLHHNGVPHMLTLDPDAGGDAASRRTAEALELDFNTEPAKVEWHKINDTATVGQIAQARSDYARSLATKVSNAIDIGLRRSTEQDSVANITLVGGGSLLQGLSPALRTALGGAPISYARLSSQITGAGGGAVDRTEPTTGGDFLVAIGLATGSTA